MSCSSNFSKTYSISGKLFIKSVSNVFNIPTKEKAMIIKRKTYPKNPKHVLPQKKMAGGRAGSVDLFPNSGTM